MPGLARGPGRSYGDIGPPWLDTETVPYGNLDDFFRLADFSETGWELSSCMHPGAGRA